MKLFEPGKIGTLEIKNRIVMGAIGIGNLVNEDCSISDEGIDYYVARAKGGTGLIVTGAARVSREVEYALRRMRVDGVTNDGTWLKKLADAVHAHGAKIALQLCCGTGRVGSPSHAGKTGGINMGKVTEMVGPSPLPCFWDPGKISRELSTGEIERLAQAFKPAAETVRKMGIDAIELHGHSGYLFDQFMTALWNKRKDKYGGDLDGRLRFALEVVRAIKEGAGKDFPLIYRYALTHYFPGGREIDEGLEIARRLETAGVDALNIDAGAYETHYWVHPSSYSPPGPMVELSAAVKKAVKIPVIAVGKLGFPDLAESVLQQNKADFILLGKALLADPEWANKVQNNRREDVCPCIGDFVCLESVRQAGHISCTVNPLTGAERANAVQPAAKKKSVLVIGGGPGGMEAAIIAAQRGHRVTLWEKGNALGGALIAACVPDFKQDYRALVDYLAAQLKKNKVKVVTGKEATVESVLKNSPDAVFVASGGVTVQPEIPGIENKNVFQAVDFLLHKSEADSPTVIIGGGLIGCEVALYLVRKNVDVTVVARHEVASDMFWASRYHLMKLLEDEKVKLIANTAVFEITEKGVAVGHDGKADGLLPARTVIIAAGFDPDKQLNEALKDKLPEVYEVGDCVEPRKVKDAIWEAFFAARQI